MTRILPTHKDTAWNLGRFTVIAGRATGTPKSRDGEVEAIRALNVVRRSAVKDRTAAINQLNGLLVTAPTPIREQLRDLTLDRQLWTIARWRTRVSDDIVTATTRQALKLLVARIGLLDDQIAQLDHDLEDLIDHVAPALLLRPAVSVVTAAQLLTTYGDNCDRIRSEAAFAHLCGVAPVPASSGRTNRHRLNQGGDRQANHALWRIAMVRMSHDERTRRYVERRTAQGLTKRDIMRCLKRYIAREIYRTITRPPTDLPPSGPQLRELRQAAGITQTDLARQTGIPNTQISRIERQVTRHPDHQRTLADHLTALAA